MARRNYGCGFGMWILLVLGPLLAWAAADVSLKSRLLSEAGMLEERLSLQEIAQSKEGDSLAEALVRKKLHHHLIEKLGLPLVVLVRHILPVWLAASSFVLFLVLAHSPLSPLPVPPLPHAPVGKFPPKQTAWRVPVFGHGGHVLPLPYAHGGGVGPHRRRGQGQPGSSEEEPYYLNSIIQASQYLDLDRLLKDHQSGKVRRSLEKQQQAAAASTAQFVLKALASMRPIPFIRACLAVGAVLRELQETHAKTKNQRCGGASSNANCVKTS
ncbi:uncharacterized protein ISCGN_018115 [Ixodes scapularis]